MPLTDRTNVARTMDPLQASFDGAVWYVNTKTPERKPRVELTPAQKLQLYGLFKVATAGPKTPTKHAVQKVNGDAWEAASHMSKQEAMAAYVELLHANEPKWRDKASAAGCPTLIAAASTNTAVWTPSKKPSVAPSTPAAASPPANEQDGQQLDPVIFSPARKVLMSPFSEAVRARVRKVYTKVEHQKRPDVDSLLIKYAGQEAKLMQLIEAKYGYDGPTPRPAREEMVPSNPVPSKKAPKRPLKTATAGPVSAAPALAPAPAPAPAPDPVPAAQASPARTSLGQQSESVPAAVSAKHASAPQVKAATPVSSTRGLSTGQVLGVALVVSGLTVVALEQMQPGLLQAKSREAAQTFRSAVSTYSSAALDLASEARDLASEACTELSARATVVIGQVCEAGTAATVALQA